MFLKQRLDPAWASLGQLCKMATTANELSSIREATLIEPVGKDKTRSLIVGVVEDRSHEVIFGH